jgi:hypothetical protein
MATRKNAGATDRVETGVPQVAHGRPLDGPVLIEIAHSAWRRARVARQIGPEARQRRSFLQDPRERPSGRDRNAVQHDPPP